MATLNYYKDETERVCKSKGWDRANVDTVWLLLTEEVGELAVSYTHLTLPTKA